MMLFFSLHYSSTHQKCLCWSIYVVDWGAHKQNSLSCHFCGVFINEYEIWTCLLTCIQAKWFIMPESISGNSKCVCKLIALKAGINLICLCALAAPIVAKWRWNNIHRQPQCYWAADTLFISLLLITQNHSWT